MPILIIIAGSIVLSISLFSYINNLHIKYLADRGYRKNFSSYSAPSDNSQDNLIKEYFIPLFIPGVNIGTLLKLLEQYYIFKSYSIDALLMMNLIVAYTPEEKIRYNENRTTKTAKSISKEAFLKEEKHRKAVYYDEHGISIIWYELYGNRYIINRCNGPLAKLPLQEQYAILDKLILVKNTDLNENNQSETNNNPETPVTSNNHLQEIQKEKKELQRVRDNITTPDSLGQQFRRNFRRSNKRPRL